METNMKAGYFSTTLVRTFEPLHLCECVYKCLSMASKQWSSNNFTVQRKNKIKIPCQSWRSPNHVEQGANPPIFAPPRNDHAQILLLLYFGKGLTRRQKFGRLKRNEVKETFCNFTLIKQVEFRNWKNSFPSKIHHTYTCDKNISMCSLGIHPKSYKYLRHQVLFYVWKGLVLQSLYVFDIKKLRYMNMYTWNPNDPCFDRKRPCFRGLTIKNRGHWGSR